jgi:phage terminase large subunit-like protein
MPQKEVKALLAKMTDEEIESLEQDWLFHARAEQYLPGGNWRTWLILAGRGFGKTRTGAETVRLGQSNTR